MTATQPPRPLTGDEQQILNIETTCAICGADAIYLWNPDRYFHLDGSANLPCWRATHRGQHDGRTERPVYIHRVQELRPGLRVVRR